MLEMVVKAFLSPHQFDHLSQNKLQVSTKTVQSQTESFILTSTTPKQLEIGVQTESEIAQSPTSDQLSVPSPPIENNSGSKADPDLTYSSSDFIDPGQVESPPTMSSTPLEEVSSDSTDDTNKGTFFPIISTLHTN